MSMCVIIMIGKFEQGRKSWRKYKRRCRGVTISDSRERGVKQGCSLGRAKRVSNLVLGAGRDNGE